jgi:hypothetical protein
MTDITVTAAKVAGQADTVTRCFKAAATITAGQCVYLLAAGTVGLADASTGGTVLINARGFAMNGGAAGDSIRVALRGPVEGFTLTADCSSLCYLSNTAGAIADAAGDVTAPVGWVAMKDDGTKFLYAEFANLTVYVA